MVKIFMVMLIGLTGLCLAEDASTSDLLNRVNGTEVFNNTVQLNIIGAIGGGLIGEPTFMFLKFHKFRLRAFVFQTLRNY